MAPAPGRPCVAPAAHRLEERLRALECACFADDHETSSLPWPAESSLRPGRRGTCSLWQRPLSPIACLAGYGARVDDHGPCPPRLTTPAARALPRASPHHRRRSIRRTQRPRCACRESATSAPFSAYGFVFDRVAIEDAQLVTGGLQVQRMRDPIAPSPTKATVIIVGFLECRRVLLTRAARAQANRSLSTGRRRRRYTDSAPDRRL